MKQLTTGTKPCTCSYPWPAAWSRNPTARATGSPTVKIQADCPHHATPDTIYHARVRRMDYSAEGQEIQR